MKECLSGYPLMILHMPGKWETKMYILQEIFSSFIESEETVPTGVIKVSSSGCSCLSVSALCM